MIHIQTERLALGETNVSNVGAALDVICVPVVPSNYLDSLIHSISKESTFKFETLNLYANRYSPGKIL